MISRLFETLVIVAIGLTLLAAVVGIVAHGIREFIWLILFFS